MHKLLERQLRSLHIPSGEAGAPPSAAEWRAFLGRVERAYVENDLDRYTLERSIELSSIEMKELHARLAAERDVLRSIFESAALGILRLSPDGVVLDANSAAVEMFGLTRATIAGKTLASLFDAEPGAKSPEGATSERSSTRADGSIRWFHRTATWVRDAAGEVTFGTVIVENVTEKKQLEVSLRHAQKLESVGRLASGVAHEINTPIQFVSDNVHFLKSAFESIGSLIAELGALNSSGEDEASSRCREAQQARDWDYLSAEVPRSIRQTLDGLERVAAIVQSMKTFAFNDQGEQSLTDLNELLASTLTVVRHELKDVAVTRRDLGAIPLVMCCRGDLGQVFLNLLVNAAHAIGDLVAERGELGVIAVSTRVEGDDAIVSVSDTGGGIREGVKDHIFEPFFTTKTVGKGTGQGLALARTIVVQRHRGALTFDTELGKGTTFHVRLPIAGARAKESRAA